MTEDEFKAIRAAVPSYLPLCIIDRQHGITMDHLTYPIYQQAAENVSKRMKSEFQQWECDLVLEYARLRGRETSRLRNEATEGEK